MIAMMTKRDEILVLFAGSYGIVTERDMVRRLDPVRIVGSDFYFHNALLGHICSHPLIAEYRGLTVYDATEK